MIPDTRGPGIGPGVDLAVRDPVEDRLPIAALYRIRGPLAPVRRGFPIRPEAQFTIIEPPGPPPGSPAPAVVVPGEVVGGIAAPKAPLEIVPGDDGHPLVFRIAFQERVAEAEEIRVRQTIVLQHHARLFLAEEPVERPRHRALAAQIGVAKQGANLAWPINRRGDFPHFGDLLCFTFAVRSRAVGGDIKARWSGFADGVEHLCGCVRAVEDQKQHRRFQGSGKCQGSCRIGHVAVSWF